jgi:hypothetical protein
VLHPVWHGELTDEPQERGAREAPDDVDAPRLRKLPNLRRHRNGARVRRNGRDFYCGPWRSLAAEAADRADVNLAGRDLSGQRRGHGRKATRRAPDPQPVVFP